MVTTTSVNALGRWATVGLVVVACTVAASAGSASDDLQRALRAYPFNLTYELMTVMVAVAFPLTELLLALTPLRRADVSTKRSPLSALTVVEVVWPLVEAILGYIADVPAAATLWLLVGFVPAATAAVLDVRSYYRRTAACRSAAFTGLAAGGHDLASTNMLAAERRAAARTCGCNRVCTATWILRVFLVVTAVGFISAPVALSWDGRPAPYVRWYAYTVNGELLFRGTFATIAFGNLLAATEPQGRHAAYVLYVAAQGIIHATMMLVASLLAASAGHPNGNVEHLYGDIAGWYLISAVLFSALLLGRILMPRRHHEHHCASGSTAGMDAIVEHTHEMLDAPPEPISHELVHISGGPK
jgi:hypothetical protein